jgi:hypothetical protein
VAVIVTLGFDGTLLGAVYVAEVVVTFDSGGVVCELLQVTPSPDLSLVTVAVKLKVPLGAMVADAPLIATVIVFRWPPLHPASTSATQT